MPVKTFIFNMKKNDKYQRSTYEKTVRKERSLKIAKRKQTRWKNHERKLNKKKFIQYEAKELDDGIANIYLLKNCTPPNLKEHWTWT